MSYAAIVVVTIYVVWGAATIANQFHSWCPMWLRAVDLFGLIPIWTFFAPNPGMTDYYLLYRDRLPDGSFDNWRKVELKESENGFRLALWNPTKRKHKALSDIVSSLMKLANHRGSDGLIVTVPYILISELHHFASALARNERHPVHGFGTQWFRRRAGTQPDTPDVRYS